jgi:hypothetical protein
MSGLSGRTAIIALSPPPTGYHSRSVIAGWWLRLGTQIVVLSCCAP